MSGLFFNLSSDFDGGTFTAVPFSAAGGDASMFVRPVVDSLVFDLLIGGKLSVKEKVCGIRPAPRPKKCGTDKLVPVCDKVKP